MAFGAAQTFKGLDLHLEEGRNCWLPGDGTGAAGLLVPHVVSVKELAAADVEAAAADDGVGPCQGTAVEGCLEAAYHFHSIRAGLDEEHFATLGEAVDEPFGGR